MNPLLDFDGLPRFDEIKACHISPAITQLLEEAEQAVRAAELLDEVRWDSFVRPLDDANERLYRAWGMVSHLQAVVNTPELRRAYNEHLPKITRYGTETGQNIHLFKQFQKLAASNEYAESDETRRRIVDNALRDFRLGGAELSADAKARFAEIQQELSALSAKFSENVLDATDAFSLIVETENELTGIPADVKAACRMPADADDKSGWKLNLQMPIYHPVMAYAENRKLRETLYRANGTKASEAGPATLDNGPIIARQLHLRRELATLLGFPSFSELSLATKMAKSSSEVIAFIRTITEKALPHAKEERAELKAFARSDLGIETVEPWDLAYVSEKLKQARYDFSAEAVKAYFTEDKVLSGMFDLIHSLYGLKVEADEAPVWHDDVRFYRLVDPEHGIIGQFYMDLYAREGKRGGAWMDECRNRRAVDAAVQTPIAYLTCNFGGPFGGAPATFGHGEVTTLFHEMGHVLHHLLTEVGEIRVAGINGVEWDAVELPSQFMENFCWEWNRLEAMTSHAASGEPLPRPLFERMLAAKNFQSGMAASRQMEFALFDMLIHDESFNPASRDIMEVLREVRAEIGVNPTPDWHRLPHSFSHIFAGSYAAGYYSYKWAEVLSADAYSAFQEMPQAIAATGARFRQEILSRGGSRPAAENFTAFRGRPPAINALLRHSGLSR